MLITKFWNWGVKHFIPWAIPGFIILSLAKAGALLQNNLFIFAMIGVICVVVGLVAFNKLSERYYLHIIGAIGFSLLMDNITFILRLLTMVGTPLSLTLTMLL